MITTIILTATVVVVSLLLGMVVALCRVSPLKSVRLATGTYVQLVQGTPLMVILFMTFFGLPALGLKISPLTAASASLLVYVSAYLGEIWRGCIEAVPVPQWEASTALAMTRWQQLRYVILPQAVRISLPPTVGFLVQIVKNTSIASIIGLVELTQAGKLVSNATFQPFLVFPIVAAIYFIFCYPLSRFSFALERKFHAHR